MATTSRRRYTPQERQRYLEQFERSGLSPAAFCRRAMIHPATFSLWRSKLKPVKQVFAEVQVSAPAAEASGGRSVLGGAGVLHLLNGARLEVALASETAWAGLGLMLKTLQA